MAKGEGGNGEETIIRDKSERWNWKENQGSVREERDRNKGNEGNNENSIAVLEVLEQASTGREN